MMLRGELAKAQFLIYLGAQTAGMILGPWLAHAMFEIPILQLSTKIRVGSAQHLSEFVATFCLWLIILRVNHNRPELTPFAVAAIITAGYWFTASTSFANPAITVARRLSDTFAGIRAGLYSGATAGRVGGLGVDLAFGQPILSPAKVSPPAPIN